MAEDEELSIGEFYWVKSHENGRWLVGLFMGDYFYFAGSEDEAKPVKVGPRIVPPE